MLKEEDWLLMQCLVL